ncbi:MAG TPA: hypothetical protein VGC56_03935 [Allosphingosinicella sp.]|jgi:hypothetical protein
MLRLSARLMCGLCTIALIPAALGAYVGLGWLDLEAPAKWSAAALVAAPLPLAVGACFAWKAAATNRARPLFTSGACVLLVIALGAIVWAWGGRMLM